LLSVGAILGKGYDVVGGVVGLGDDWQYRDFVLGDSIN
jgi:hypothetical protein